MQRTKDTMDAQDAKVSSRSPGPFVSVSEALPKQHNRSERLDVPGFGSGWIYWLGSMGY